MSRWITVAVAGVATAALLAGGATAASTKKPAGFKQVLAAKLGRLGVGFLRIR